MPHPFIWLVLIGFSAVPELEAQGAGAGAPLDLENKLVAQNPAVRDISDMRIMEGPGTERHLLVAGTRGVFEMDLETAEVLREGAFDLPSHLPSMIVDADGDGRVELARFSSGWVGPTAVIELNGSTRWSRETPGRCHRPMDLDADGKAEILVGQPNDRTVRLLDHRGQMIWEREWTATNADAFPWDVDGDGKMELLYVDGEVLQVCDRDGKHLFVEGPPEGGFVNAIERITAPEVLGGAQLLVGAHVHGRQVFHAYDRGARKHVSEHSWDEVAPFVDSQRIQRANGDLLIRLENQKEQAFPAGYKSSELLLSIFDIRGHLVFERRMSKPGKELATADGALVVLEEVPLRFLVGYGDRIWEYTER